MFYSARWLDAYRCVHFTATKRRKKLRSEAEQAVHSQRADGHSRVYRNTRRFTNHRKIHVSLVPSSNAISYRGNKCLSPTPPPNLDIPQNNHDGTSTTAAFVRLPPHYRRER